MADGCDIDDDGDKNGINDDDDEIDHKAREGYDNLENKCNGNNVVGIPNDDGTHGSISAKKGCHMYPFTPYCTLTQKKMFLHLVPKQGFKSQPIPYDPES